MFSPGEIGNNGYVILFLVECLGGGGGGGGGGVGDRG